jgi:hypothetical protein
VTRGYFQSAGESVGVDCRLPWVSRLIREVSPHTFTSVAPARHSCYLHVEADRDAFDLRGFEPLTRGAWRRQGTVVIENVCTSGFDLMYRSEDDRPAFRFRWRPPLRDRLASAAAPSRFVLLARAALLQYPVLWLASTQGRAPLHAAICTAGPMTPLLAGPGGVGKSTLLAAELAAGARATSDNLCVSDGVTAWGLVEPLKIAAGEGRRMPHGRGEATIKSWIPQLTPDRLVVLRRGLDITFSVRPSDPEAAVRSLVTGTYTAGELRRYWAVAATLTAGTGVGPAHPPIESVARRLASNLPCLEVVLPSRPGVRLADLLSPLEAA